MPCSEECTDDGVWSPSLFTDIKHSLQCGGYRSVDNGGISSVLLGVRRINLQAQKDGSEGADELH